MLKDCREFQKLSESMVQMRQQAPIPAFGNTPAPGEIAHGAPPPPPVGGPNQPVAPAQNNAGNGYPQPKGALMIQKGRPTNRTRGPVGHRAITSGHRLREATRNQISSPPGLPCTLDGAAAARHPRHVAVMDDAL